MSRTTASLGLVAVGLGLAAAAANVIGGLLVVRRDWSRQYLQYFVGLGAGFMLTAVLLEVFPESLALAGEKAFLFVLVGYLVVHFFEHTLAPHFHFGEETHVESIREKGAGYFALLGLGIHTFFDGVAVGSGFLISPYLGGVIFLAVFLHKLPEGFTIASLMLASGQSRKTALLSAALLGGLTLLGVLLMNVLKAQLAYALPLSAGVTLYVAATDLIPEANHQPGFRMAGMVFLGVALMFVLHFLFRM